MDSIKLVSHRASILATSRKSQTVSIVVCSSFLNSSDLRINVCYAENSAKSG